ncbi:MAG: gfo/Idh/MocA family oxidoreductase, partial [Planctomycetes bacterium]|nr:gfo/Idh/MocA family oxidoreductase [Planctomycetota bacterium]
MFDSLSRREFLRQAVLAGTAAASVASSVRPADARDNSKRKRKSPNEKLNIGVANRGRANLNGVVGENIVALCDID